MKRQEKILHLIDKQGYGIEIGASYNPIAPKRAGYNVHVIDHLNREQLIEKYRGHNVPLENIEAVDYVWKGETYVELTGKKHYYDWIIGSHVIEHTPDLIGFLDNCAGILKEDGVISLVIPDMRFCFDHFRPLTGLSKVIDAHFQAHIKNTPGSVAEHFLNYVTRGGQITWHAKFRGDYAFGHSLEEARQALARAQSSSDNQDVHTWCFTPSSFRLLLHDLRCLGLTSFHEVAYFPTDGFEFYVTLGQAEDNRSPDRLQLLKQIRAEMTA